MEEWKLYPQNGYEVLVDDHVKPLAIMPCPDVEKRTVAFFRKGMRNTAAAVFLTHRWLTPHLLFFLRRKPTADDCGLFSCSVPPGQNAKEVLQDRLSRFVTAPSEMLMPGQENLDPAAFTPTVGEFLGSLWVAGPNDLHHPLPFLPPHVTRPREHIKLFQVHLVSGCAFRLPSDYTIKSVPIGDLSVHLPPLALCLQQLPYMLARFNFAFFEEGDDDDAAARRFHGSAPRGSSATARARKPTTVDAVEDAQHQEIQALAKQIEEVSGDAKDAPD